MSSTYLIALGSNRRHHLYGRPPEIVRAAMEEMAALGMVAARSPIIASPPMGPAQRRFANAVCVLESEYDPLALLAALKRMEAEFGRRPGRRWGDRVLDLDIILWSGGIWSDNTLSVPHSEFRQRDFVLQPAKAIAPDWRDPVSGLTIAHLAARCR
ncbi:2-amino-4-hydroxy-6-hydroxymethyldihydropteridine diphosphokinase [Erythrobacter sp. MTPC3]|uniref:2-amino-4-hydroxy-6- hydroxymethyldihydropteridine diphosphokinase n=1 Tax=Erythrobacter sp. MTPC3 TaxID=3056564 RepID=UPI0036F33007